MQDSKARGTVWEVPAGKFNAGATKLWNSLGESGQNVITQLDGDPDYCRRVAEFMRSGGMIPSLHQELACEIMGKENVWLPIDWCRYYGYPLTEKEFQQTVEIPFSPEVLEQAKDDYFLLYAMPIMPNGEGSLTVRMLWSLLEVKDDKSFAHVGPWIDSQSFDGIVKDTLSGWHLVRKEIIPDSVNKSYSEQASLLDENLQVPSPIQEAMKSILVYIKTGKRVNQKKCSRTSCMIYSNGAQEPEKCISVGFFPQLWQSKKISRGLMLWAWHSYLESHDWMRDIDYARQPDLGMGAAWRPAS